MNRLRTRDTDRTLTQTKSLGNSYAITTGRGGMKPPGMPSHDSEDQIWFWQDTHSRYTCMQTALEEGLGDASRANVNLQ